MSNETNEPHLASNSLASVKSIVSDQIVHRSRVATVREKYLENDIFSRSGKSQGIL